MSGSTVCLLIMSTRLGLPGQPVANDYDSFAGAYAAETESNLLNDYYARPAILDLAGDVAGRRILDVGCGAGPLAAIGQPAGAVAAGPVLGRVRAGAHASLGKLRDELTDAVNNLEVGLVPAAGPPVLGMSDSARFAYISHRPYTRAGRKADEVLAFVVHPLIHADDNVGPGETRRSQLVAITSLSKFPDAILRKKVKCCSVRSQVSGPVRCGGGPARYSLQIRKLE